MNEVFERDSLTWPNRYAALGPAFHTELPAQGLPDPHWIVRSAACARDLGWPADWWSDPRQEALAVFSGNALWPGMRPLASVYSGHQFGVWAGQLGDGRALWLGEVDSPSGAQELQLKGGGPTPYSRRADGRAVLRSTIREFLCSEAMHHLGIPSTRALCATGSALPVQRETPETAAIVTRVAPSFVRFGHFEHFSHHGQIDALRTLADFVLHAHFPECLAAPQPVAAMLEEVTRRTARLVAQWQAVGFCHGVMNTDNMSILGLTIDYGPFGFLDAFDPGHVCNHSDHQGRYAYARQPPVALWNLHALATALVPLVDGDTDSLKAALQTFDAEFSAAMQAALRAKMGLRRQENGDVDLGNDFLRLLATARSDFTQSFRRLALLSSDPAAPAPLRDDFLDRDAFDAWAQRYRERLGREDVSDAERAAGMNRVNPKFILRNHLAEIAIRHASAGDFSEVDRLQRVLERPFDEQPQHADCAALPPDWAKDLEVSCSS